MKTSFSKPTYFLDVPEVINPKVIFNYQFYEPNELQTLSTLSQQTDLKRVPRYNTISFVGGFNNLVDIGDNSDYQLFVTNLSKVNYEFDIKSTEFTGLKLSDPVLDESIATEIKKVNITKIDDLLAKNDIFLSSSVTLNNLGITFNKSVEQNVAHEIEMENMRSVFLKFQSNSNYLGNILKFNKNPKNSAGNYITGYEPVRPTNISSQEYMPLLNVEEIDIAEPKGIQLKNNIIKKVKRVGFLVKKYVYNGNSFELVETIPIKPNSPVTYNDTRIFYNRSYKYAIASVYIVYVPYLEIGYFGYLVASSEKDIYVDTVENKIPPPPIDLKISWDYNKNCSVLNWRFPIETQKDVKIFQIFRRKSLDEPYTLLAQYDFRDYKNFPLLEKVSSNLNKNLSKNDLKTVYYDRTFEIDKSYIYAVSCIDAHSNISSLSKQIMVNFDVFTSKLETKVVSNEGAPKFYPNLLLKEPIFIESIKTNKFNEMSVYLDSDNGKLSVVKINTTDEGDSEKKLLATIFKQNFNINIIDTELQESINFNIKVDNI